MKNKVLAAVFILGIFFSVFSIQPGFAKKEKFDNYQQVAMAMKKEFENAKEAIDKKEYKAAHGFMNNAYFGYYEVQGFEANVMNIISKKRVLYIEGKFRNIKHELLGNYGEIDGEKLKQEIDSLCLAVYKDGMVLDGIASASDDDEVAREYVFGKEEAKVDQSAKNRNDFLSAFLVMLREGMEAILVIVAIIAYLIKTGNQHLCKKVYLGVLAAVIFSIVLAVALVLILGSTSNEAGIAREMIEGWTMFLAVGVLFYVSNWMLSKSGEKAFEKYVHSQVVKATEDSKHSNSLVFAAFLAVAREGAELILIYTASFSGGNASKPYIIGGFLLASVILVVVYILYRYFAVKLPLKPFFLFTSVFLFLMCISFMGKGVIELTEAGVISGSTAIPAMGDFSIPMLNIYPRAEILIPQMMLLIASIWIIISNLKKDKEAV